MRLASDALCLGVLSCLVVWLVHWALMSRVESNYGMPGDITSMHVSASSNQEELKQVQAAFEEMRELLLARGLTLLVASVGDGSPSLSLLDPSDRLEWAATAVSRNGDVKGTFAFEGSYSARRWVDAKVSPLTSEKVMGVVSPPSGVGQLQFLQPLSAAEAGRYVVSDATAEEVRLLHSLLERQGLQVQAATETYFVTDVVLQPLVVVTALLLAASYACVCLHWWTQINSRGAEIAIRRRHGASPEAIGWGLFRREWPGIALGHLLGAAAFAAIAVIVGGEQLERGEAVLLATAAVVGLAFSCVLRSMTLIACCRWALREHHVS